MKKVLLFITTIFLVSCSTKSGRYISSNGKWTFVENNVGFTNFLNNPKRGGQVYSGNLDSSDFLWPVPSSTRISSHFGMRKGRHHDGVDIPATKGSHILATKSGTVNFSGWMRGYGRIIVLKHDQGIHTIYAHNKKHFVKKGQRVSKGEVIAQVGNSGKSRGSHLHFEVRQNNKVVNPFSLIQKAREVQLAKN
jgi:murein DD-endopeptidase MepM/ murein hydrolase activator NlpD